MTDDINTLMRLNQALSTESTEVLEAKINDPKDSIGSCLTSYITKSFSYAEQKRSFTTEIEEAIRARIAEFSPVELIEILKVSKQNDVAMIDRLITPFADVMSSAVSAESVKSKNTEESLFHNADKNVLQGITALYALLEKAQQLVVAPDKKNEQEK